MTAPGGARPEHLAFRAATPDDAIAISALAREIWTAVYVDLIGIAQIEFMLDLMYDPQTLRSEIAHRGVAYFFVESQNQPAGFLAFSIANSQAHLHKLYLKPAFHRRGIGSACLSWLSQRCHSAGAASIHLRVNKRNSPAIRTYEKNGFHRSGSICEDIGKGFTMDDFLYVRTLP